MIYSPFRALTSSELTGIINKISGNNGHHHDSPSIGHSRYREPDGLGGIGSICFNKVDSTYHNAQMTYGYLSGNPVQHLYDKLGLKYPPGMMSGMIR